MLYSIAAFYLFLKIAFLFGLVRVQVKSDAMQERWLLLSVIYTAGVAILSLVFLVGTNAMSWSPWQKRLGAMLGVSPYVGWLGQTLVLSAIYFKLMGKFDDGFAFFLLLVLGLGLAWF